MSIGYLIYTTGRAMLIGESAGFIVDSFVTEGMRNKGVAEKMIDFAAQPLKAKGVRRLYIYANPVNRNEMRLWEKLGFRTVNITMSKRLH